METYGYIYITTNKINGKRYIGKHKSKDWDSKYIGSGKLLKRAIKKYGIENFQCFPLMWAWNEKELNQLEIEYIEHYQPEYNIMIGGGDGSTGKKWYLSEETKEKISEKHKGKTFTNEHRKNLSNSHLGLISGNKGNKYSAESKEKISASKKGKLLSEEHKKNLSLNNNKYWLNKKRSEESKKKMSIAKLGKKQSEELIKKRVESRKGYKHSEETKQKIKEGNLNKIISFETRQKISELQKGFKWFNNGIINTGKKICPEGFNPGMLRKAA
jgi:hypothetical protein